MQQIQGIHIEIVGRLVQDQKIGGLGQTHVEPGLAFRGERQDFEEMVGNLLDNAFKWAKGKVVLSATKLEAGKDQTTRPTFLLSIDDDGDGLSEEERAQVMERGARLDESVSGSGLGLSIVTDINELYGGAFKMEASKLGGVRATLQLPVA